MIYEWHEAINNDPEMMVKYSQLTGEFMRKAMYGDSEAAGGETVIEGINLDQYARACAALQGKSEAEVPTVIAGLGIFTDMAHWGRVRDGFNAAMGADTSLKLATHFGELFAKYGQQHMAASTQYSVDVVTMGRKKKLIAMHCNRKPSAMLPRWQQLVVPARSLPTSNPPSLKTPMITM